MFKVPFIYYATPISFMQWGSEIRTRPNIEWSKRGWFANGLDFEWYLNYGSPTILNLDKWQSFCQKPLES